MNAELMEITDIRLVPVPGLPCAKHSVHMGPEGDL